MTSQSDLYHGGLELMNKWCRINKIRPPEFILSDEPRRFNTCAFYRPEYVKFCVPACARPGYGGRAWSWPGYTVDRTPYGVVQHELGHHVDFMLSRKEVRAAYYGDMGHRAIEFGSEDAISGYCPNPGEWFAEIFRVFLTNPDLLRLLRPKTHAWLLSQNLKPVIKKQWDATLSSTMGRVPDRYLTAVDNKLRKLK